MPDLQKTPDYQNQDSPQTLAQGMAEYFASNEGQLLARMLTPEGEEFYRYHDAAHVVFGCDISLNDELVVKICSILGTTEGWRVIRGYRLAESKEVYKRLHFLDILGTTAAAFFLIPRTIWRCARMRKRWRWDDFDDFLDVPLNQIRNSFAIRVVR
ncbi:MAG: hypothetical protein HQ495_13810 [Alphaproteobacteria bacterium]|nr:hypothetical protein [Alphaproteobacteria bacterium]